MSPPDEPALPPGQRLAQGWPTVHYGPVPADRRPSWDLTITGATADGADHVLDLAAFEALPEVRVVADLHCVTRWTMPGNEWTGVPTRALLDLYPPADGVDHVMVWAEYGYSANLRMQDLASPRAVLATRHRGTGLSPEKGGPVRLVVPHLYAYKGPKWVRGLEYLTEPGRGFWEQRGYHAIGDAWRQERWSYQE